MGSDPQACFGKENSTPKLSYVRDLKTARDNVVGCVTEMKLTLLNWNLGRLGIHSCLEGNVLCDRF